MKYRTWLTFSDKVFERLTLKRQGQEESP